MSQTTSGSPKSTLKTMETLYYAFMSAPLLFSFVILIINEDYSFFNQNHMSTFYYFVPFAAVGIIYIGLTIFKNQVSNIKSDLSLSKKLSQYQSATIIKCAMLEGPALLCVVLALLSQQLVFIIIAWCILVFMYMMRPTKAHVINDLQLNSEERSQLK